jgi:hypothetical protein
VSVAAEASRTILLLGVLIVPLVIVGSYGLLFWLFRKSGPEPDEPDARNDAGSA